MKKLLKRCSSVLLVINLLIMGSTGYAKVPKDPETTSTDQKFELVDQELEIYRLCEKKTWSNDQVQDALIQDGDVFYIHLQDDLYAIAEKKEFYASDSLEGLRPETKAVVEDIFKSCESDVDGTLIDGKVEVYIPSHEENLYKSPALAAVYPVTNEQARYVRVTNEKVIESGSNAFQNYANGLLSNAAKLIAQKVASYISPYAGVVTTLAGLFPSKYNTVKSYKNWTLGVKLQEEKVVQLSWVYVDNSPYFGAQTQFATIRAISIMTPGIGNVVTDQTGYMYYRTPYYQNPADVARQNYLYGGWVERLEQYRVYGTLFDSQS